MEQIEKSVRQRIVVLGANGGIGRQVVLQALAAGHQVTAILRSPEKLAIADQHLEIVKGDVMNPGSLTEHFMQKDTLISAIGRNSFKRTTLYSQGSKNVIYAMQESGLKRAFFISASGIEVNPTHSLLIRLATRFILQAMLRNMYADQVVMESLIKSSFIDWTIIRPPKLLNKPKTGNYRVSLNTFLDNGISISRADVAHFIVSNLINKAIVRKTVEIAY
ncbi:NAD(P)-dependent oxidoreductase [Mucilaginibacter aquariorum]|uniref:SDR family oxidoreductase n=1 Tax=Mucilaginibacter aquariorum TaxID=2967225 RepID=A0ABT1SVL9_9SPHI|nr:SDR family oxidoreductase [Mucilaginibacter aquariorum]MCQ6956380.1 SDR family oxidoreductase [Mucilaginibacter aquariorum]